MSYSTYEAKRAGENNYNQRNPEQRRVRRAKHNAHKQRIVNEAKSLPCVDCGLTFPPGVMDLDHVRGIKLGSVGYIQRTCGIAKLQAEIAKCDVRCANCHRLRHLNEKEH